MKKGMKEKEAADDDDPGEDQDRSYRIQSKTFGGKAADSLASWVGSWHYIIILTAFLIVWIIINTSFFLSDKSWDPSPFILLNLLIGAIAAIEVPIILMSQNRQEKHDSAREEYDYALNRKAEKEIREIREQLNRIEEKLKE